MLLPKRVKYRRVHRGRMKGKATRGTMVNYGDFGLVALEPAWISSSQIEAARVAMNRYIKRGGKVWIKIFPDKPVTQKPAKREWVQVKARPNTGCCCKARSRPFEIGGCRGDRARGREACSQQLPIVCKFVSKSADGAGMTGTGGEQEKGPNSKNPRNESG